MQNDSLFKLHEETIQEIFNRLAKGEYLYHILDGSNPDYPSRPTFYEWLDRWPELRIRYDNYREAQIIKMEESLDAEADKLETMVHDSTKLVNHSAGVQLLEFKLKKLMHLKRSVKPRKYGDNPAYPLNIEGDTPEERLESLWAFVKVGKISPKEANEYVAFLTKQIEIRDLKPLADTINDLKNMREKK